MGLHLLPEQISKRERKEMIVRQRRTRIIFGARIVRNLGIPRSSARSYMESRLAENGRDSKGLRLIWLNN